MLPSFRKRLSIRVCVDRIEVRQTTRGWRPATTGPIVIEAKPLAEELALLTPLRALSEYFAETNHAGADVDVTVADAFVRYALIPWSDEITNQTELMALVRIHFETLVGAAVASWEARADISEFGKAGIACAFAPLCVDAVRELCAANHLRLTSLQSDFMVSFNRARPHFEPDAMLVVVDRGSCVIACIKQDAWHSIRSVRSSSYSSHELSVLITREKLLQDLADQAPVYVDVLTPVDMTDLQAQRGVRVLSRSLSAEAA